MNTSEYLFLRKEYIDSPTAATTLSPWRYRKSCDHYLAWWLRFANKREHTYSVKSVSARGPWPLYAIFYNINGYYKYTNQ